MIKKIFPIIGIIILLAGFTSSQASVPVPGFENISVFSQPNSVSIKKRGSYDESKDPALRKGTENWEEPQGSFFIIPAVVLGLVVVVLFFNRK
jgi:hypothetical protein